MSERELSPLLQKLRSTTSHQAASPILSQAKLLLLKLHALTPTPQTPPNILSQAREIFELGALLSIRATLPDAFVRYMHLLRPFYELADSQLSSSPSPPSENGTSGSNSNAAVIGQGERNKITGLYLLLLLTQGDYAGFHTELEGLEMRWNTTAVGQKDKVEDDRFLGYPIKLERWLMEGAYDLVWQAMASGKVPSEEYGVFCQILTSQIRSEIASCSETAYPSLPVSSTKNLLFLESEGAVVEFAQNRGWSVQDGRIYFPNQAKAAAALDESGEEKEMSQVAIENTLGYARELETIV